jgi:hypothetical protein
MYFFLARGVLVGNIMFRFALITTLILLALNVCLAQLGNSYYNPADGILYAQCPSPTLPPEGESMSMLFRFEDSGARLIMINHDVPGRIISLDNVPGHLFTWLEYQDGRREVYQTADSGETWSQIGDFPIHIIGLSRQGEVAGQSFSYSGITIGNKIYFTSDGWNTLDSVQAAFLPDSIRFNWFGCHNGIIYGTTINTGRICISSDTGRTWSLGYRDPITHGIPDAAGAEDEIWGKFNRVYVLHDTGRTATDSVFVPHLNQFPYAWEPYLIPTNQPGEVYYLASREYWTEPPILEIVLYHIDNYGAQVDSFHYAVPIEYNAVNVHLQPETFHLSAYPNPFNSSVTLEWDAQYFKHNKIAIYDILGRRIWEWCGYGNMTHWDGRNIAGTVVPSGEYFVTFFNDALVNNTVRIVLLK